VTTDVTLTYFDTRGRAQYLRYYLRSRDVAFEDRRVPLSADFSEWRAMRDDRSISGPFNKLPVLRWQDRQIAEMLSIQSFLHKKLGDDALLSEEESWHHSMLTSSLYIDVMMPLGTLIWADAVYPGADARSSACKATSRRSIARSPSGAGSRPSSDGRSCSRTASYGRSSTARATCSANA
jgi:hypothetical protein